MELNYHILTKDEIAQMVQARYRQYVKIADEYIKNKAPDLENTPDKKSIFQELIKILAASDAYHGMDIDILLYKQNLNLNDLTQLKKQVHNYIQKIHKYKDYLEHTLSRGKKIRSIEKPSYPEMFKNSDRCYIRIPAIQNNKEKIEFLLKDLNEGIPLEKEMELRIDKKENGTSYFIYQDKQTQPVGRFLSRKISKLTDFLEKYGSLPEQKRSEILEEIKTANSFYTKEETNGQTKKQDWLKNNYHLELDPVLFNYIKEKLPMIATAFYLEEIMEDLKRHLVFVKKAIDFEQSRQQKDKDLSSVQNVDTILFSKSPKDIAWMSAYTDYDNTSCMCPVGGNHECVQGDIGFGTIIAYAFNSKNPQKRISRILLKPYLSKDKRIIYYVGKTYGEKNFVFDSFVRQWSKKHFDSPVVDKYDLHPRLYNDAQPKSTCNAQNLQDYCRVMGRSFKIKDGLFICDEEFDLSECQFPVDWKNTKLYRLKVQRNDVIPPVLPITDNLSFKGYCNKFPTPLDLSRAKRVTFGDCNLAKLKFIGNPELSLTFWENAKLPTMLDLSQTKEVHLYESDLKETLLKGCPSEELELNNCLNVKGKLDLSRLKKAKFSSVDLKDFIIENSPQEELEISDCKNAPKELNLNGLKSATLKNIDFEKTKIIGWPSEKLVLEKCQNFHPTEKIEKLETLSLKDMDIKDLKFSNAQIKKLSICHCPNLSVQLDLNEFEEVEIKRSDLSKVQFIGAPKEKFRLNDCTSLPETLDLHNTAWADLDEMDLSNVKTIIPPKRAISFSESCEIPDIDLSNTDFAYFSYSDLFRFTKLPCPKNSISITKCSGLKELNLANQNEACIRQMDLTETPITQLPKESLELAFCIHYPKQMDFSQVPELKLSSADFSECERIIGPRDSLKTSEVKGLKNNLHLPHLKKLDIYSQDMDELQIKDWCADQVSLSKCTNLSQMDLSQATCVSFHDMDLKGLKIEKLPKHDIAFFSCTSMPEELKPMIENNSNYFKSYCSITTPSPFQQKVKSATDKVKQNRFISRLVSILKRR